MNSFGFYLNTPLIGSFMRYLKKMDNKLSFDNPTF